MVERYEDLRRQVLGQKDPDHRGQGLRLFLGQGMKAWMNTWLCCLPAGPTRMPQEFDAAVAVVPWDLRGEVAAILAGMAMSMGQEMNA